MKSVYRYNFKARVGIFVFAFLFLFIVFIWNLYVLQIVKYDYFSGRAEHQYGKSRGFYDRGSVFFSDKDGNEISVAGISYIYSLAISPKNLKEKEAENLYKLLVDLGYKVDRKTFFAKASKAGDPHEDILRQIKEKDIEKIKKVSKSGIIISKNRIRYYPFESLASQLIGFVAFVGDKLHGVYGLERYYDYILYRDEADLGVNFFVELLTDMKNFATGKAFKNNGSIVSSVDLNVQKELEKILKETKEKWGSKRVSAIVYNPQNGEIIAMASYPNFDLNKFRKYNEWYFKNPLVENVYEMGSIIKVITMASALDSGAVKETSTYNDTGIKVYDGSKIANYDKRARGPGTTMQDILSQSLNIGAAWLYEKMGKDTFRSYFEKLGLREETGIDLPNEALNLTSNLNSPRDIEYATASFGQGVAFTPISTVRALGAVATGVLRQPHLVKKIKLDNGFKKNKDYSDYDEKVFKKETVETVARMLSNVVDEALAHGKYKKEHYSIAAKTGTAQIAKPGGGYYEDLYNHTFMGYFPAFNPRFVILFINERPKGAKYASQTLSKPFFDLVDFLINYYNIEPDR